MKSPTKPRAKAVRFNLFFLEMIIVLLFFSIASAVILNSFSASDRLASRSRLTESMTFCAQSTAEFFSKTGDLSQTVEELFGGSSAQIIHADLDGGVYISEAKIPLTESCEYSPQNPEIYIILTETAEQSAGGMFKTLSIKFEDTDSEELYQITTGAYIPDKTGADLNELY